jgi:hypothetical protein
MELESLITSRWNQRSRWVGNPDHHEAEYARDDRFHHVYGGFMPQSALDKRLFWRQVQINLNLDENRRFKKAEVNIFYTAL